MTQHVCTIYLFSKKILNFHTHSHYNCFLSGETYGPEITLIAVLNCKNENNLGTNPSFSEVNRSISTDA